MVTKRPNGKMISTTLNEDGREEHKTSIWKRLISNKAQGATTHAKAEVITNITTNKWYNYLLSFA